MAEVDAGGLNSVQPVSVQLYEIQLPVHWVSDVNGVTVEAVVQPLSPHVQYVTPVVVPVVHISSHAVKEENTLILVFPVPTIGEQPPENDVS